MKMIGKSVTVLLLIATLGGSAVFAGNSSKKGTAGAIELTIPVGARGTALAGAGMANVSGLDAIYWNPAGLGTSTTSSEALFSRTNYIADMSINYVAAGVNVAGVGSVALSLKSFSFGDIPVTTELSPEGTGETYSPRYTTLGLTYSRALTDRVAAGVTVKLVSETIERTSATGVAFDAGIQYGFGAESVLHGLRFGVVLKNLGPTMQFDGTDLERSVVPPDAYPGETSRAMKFTSQAFELPSTLEMALSYDLHLGDVNRITLMTLFRNNNYSEDEYAGAVEYCYDETITLRGGYITSPDVAADAYTYGLTMGAGVNLDLGGMILGVDYAYSSTQVFKGINTLAVRIGF